MNFNEKLIELRKSRGMSQEELGNELNVTRQTVSKWELGVTTPEMNKLIEMSRLFDISIDELVGNETKQENNSEKNPSEFNIRDIHYEYKSKRTLFNLPLVHINVGVGMYKAKGIVAIGNISVGLVSLGLISVGLIAWGILALGLLIAFGVLSLGLLSAGAVAIGAVAAGGVAVGYFATGGLAIGVYSIGGCALANNIAMGGYANGKIAIGDSVSGTVEFIKDKVTHNELLSAINQHLPDTPEIIKNIFLSGWSIFKVNATKSK